MTEYEKLLSKTKVNSSAGVGISQENVNKRNNAQTAKSTAAKTKTVPTIKALGASDYAVETVRVVPVRTQTQNANDQGVARIRSCNEERTRLRITKEGARHALIWRKPSPNTS